MLAFCSGDSVNIITLRVGIFNTAVTSLLAASIASSSTILLNVQGEEVPRYKPIFLYFKILELINTM